MSDEEPDLVEDAVSKKELIIAKNAKDVQKMRLDKLMENPVQQACSTLKFKLSLTVSVIVMRLYV